MIGVRRRRARSSARSTTSSASRRWTPRPRTWSSRREYMFKGVPALRARRRSARDARVDDGPLRHRQGAHGRRPRRQLSGRALERVPRPLLPDVPGRSEPGHGRGARARRGRAGARRQGRAVLGHRAHPAGAAQRQEDVSRLREVRGARHPDLRVRGRARAPHPVRAAVRRLCSTRCAGSSPSSRSSRATAANRGPS